MAVHADFAKVVEKMIRDALPAVGDRHPFHRKIVEGHATRDDLAIWAVQTYHRNLYSSRFASANHSRCPIKEVRLALLEVVKEEELAKPGAPPSHAELMVRFAEATGLSREEIFKSRPLNTTLVFIDTLMQLSEGHWLEGISFRASEIASPEGCALWHDVLQKKYGFSAAEVTWFKTHEVADIEHGNIAIDAYGKYARDEAEQTISIRAIERMLAAWDVFDYGVLRAGEEARQGRDIGFRLPSQAAQTTYAG